MKLVTAIIQPFRLEQVKQALSDTLHKGLTVTEVRGYGAQKGHTEVYRGTEFQVDFRPKVRIDLIVSDEDAAEVIETIIQAARTGSLGDGKIWTQDISDVIRVRTGERGIDAV
ncbi:nitrogen regulatory protein P-II 1 [Neomicrococcus aestuarii]|uniref:Nitrogen regulatory protein P-II 1 n=1 Tax=Neomicrococcus aestuarii TaxID=556325 RepID=A0A7W8WZ69_9MICC|nr:P-II family nitrogen regulator [Neomicrococcus aestuarii]MBB5511972.1 nitrogen regulatory protein P-II 1 [Neomicrococcus aestuarii]